MINIGTRASAVPSRCASPERFETLRKRVALVEGTLATRQAVLAGRVLQLQFCYVRINYPIFRKELFFRICTFLSVCSVAYASLQLFIAAYRLDTAYARVAAAKAALAETPEAKEAAERERRAVEQVKRDAEEALALRQLMRRLMLLYRLLFPKPLYPLLVRIRLRLAMRPGRRILLLSLLEICQLYGDREESADHDFLLGRHHPTFRGVACAVI
jgi:hypothetical protein